MRGIEIVNDKENPMRSMVNSLFILLIGFTGLFPLTGQNLWQWKNPLPQGNTLHSVFFADSQTGYAVGAYGAIIKTVNGGQDWTQLNSGVTRALLSVFFTDIQTGYAVGGNLLLKTTDGGNTWASGAIGGATDIFNSIYFINTDTGYVAGSNTNSEARIFKTTDGGASWTQQNTPGMQSIRGIFFTDANTGYTAGGNLISQILKTTNGGASWTVSEPGNFTSLNDIHFVTATNGVAVGEDGRIIRTTNGGTSWNFENNSGNFTDLNAVHFPTAATGYAIAEQAVLKTIDGGDNWQEIQWMPERTLHGTFFTTPDSGFVVGLGGYIQSTADGGANWSDNTPLPITIQSTFFVDADTGYFGGAGYFEGAIYKTTDGGESFTKLTLPSPVTAISSMFFTNENTGYAATILNSDRVILKTTDGGDSWSPVPSNTTAIITSIHFPNPGTGYAVGTSGALVKTTDGGESWNALSTGTSNTLNSVFFVDAQTGYIAGDIATLRKTTNGGLNWAPQNSGLIGQLSSIYFTSFDAGYIAGTSGRISRTTNGGVNWQAMNTASTDLLRSVHFANMLTGYVVGESGTILATTDGGLNWNLEESGTNSSLFSVFVPNADVAYTVGLAGTILKREGLSNTAPSITSTPDTVAIVNSFYFYQVTATDPDGDPLTFRLLTSPAWLSIDSTSGIIHGIPSASNIGDTVVTVSVFDNRGGSDQQTYTLVVTVPVAIDDPGKPNLTEQFYLEQNYPNPFNPVTVISYYLPSDSEVQIEIFNLLGQNIRTLVNQRKAKGAHQIRWDGRNDAGNPVTSGIYIYRMKAGDYVSIKKMALLR